MKAKTATNLEHLKLEQLAPGVYAAIALERGGAYSNAGIIDLGDQTLIFDTLLTPQAAQELRDAAEKISERQVRYVINSHAHTDHVMGNQVFADHATIVSTRMVRDKLPAMTEHHFGMQKNPSELKQLLQDTQERLKTEDDELERRALEKSIARWGHVLETLPTHKLHLPMLTFDAKLFFCGSQRSAKLRTLGAGHTASDCFLLLPEEKIAFMGDLCFFQSQPYMADCDPQAWVAQLEALERSDIETFVPGHGPVGVKADVTLEKDYILMLEQRIARAVRQGQDAETFLQQPLPEPFDAWLVGGMARFEANVRSAYQRHVAEIQS